MVSTTHVKRYGPTFHSRFRGHRTVNAILVESRTIQSDLNIDVLHPLVVVFLQFKICILFPRHMYKDMVLLSTIVLGPFKNVECL